ncbi:MAG TPA: hypothetical protein VKW08_07000 [Xanthobacteraceae bacterium]|jgi:hypothetical protein|nr:hypothetical protein [Xanthobacteraceae bacterium]
MAKPGFFQRIRSRQRPLWLAALGASFAVIAWQLLTPRERRKAIRPSPAGHERPLDPPQHGELETAYEPSDWPLRPVVLTYLAALVLLVTSALVLMAAYPSALPDVDRTLHIAPPGPRLETDSATDLQKLRAEEDRRLNTYYWIDRQNGVVHIPIEQEMKKLAKAGVPGFPKAEQ